MGFIQSLRNSANAVLGSFSGSHSQRGQGKTKNFEKVNGVAAAPVKPASAPGMSAVPVKPASVHQTPAPSLIEGRPVDRDTRGGVEDGTRLYSLRGFS